MISHFLRQSVQDFFTAKPAKLHLRAEQGSDQDHLEAAIHWLLLSLEKGGGNASAKSYRFLKGWMPPYPETSGYIIPTLLALAPLYPEKKLNEQAAQVGMWLRDIQRKDGGFVGREIGALDKPIIFDTGMILHGLTALMRSGDMKFEKAARKAADFLCGAQDESGCYVMHLSNDIVHTYNVRAAWAVMKLSKMETDATRAEKYQQAARANADWALAQQNEVGYFHSNEFKPGGNANLHGVSYVLRGLYEIYELDGGEDVLQAVIKTAEQLVRHYDRHKFIAGELGPNWEYLSNYICLTGYAQLAIILMKLSQKLKREDFFDSACRLLSDLGKTQNITHKGTDYYGGIRGSYPVYGRYAPLQYPNWATKFYIDALVLKREIERRDVTQKAAE